jgi:hypothetical protein
MDDVTIQGFLIGIALSASLFAFLAAGFAALALIKVFAFERSTHKIEWMPVDPRDVGGAGKIETGDEELDEALADAEEKELEGLHGVHHRQGPLI